MLETITTDVLVIGAGAAAARAAVEAADDNRLKHVCITNQGGEIAIPTVPVVTGPR